MAVGHSDDLDAAGAIAEALEQCAEALGGQTPKAALLLSAFGTDCEETLAAVNQAYPDIQLVGCTTAGEMSSVLGFQEDSITLALFASDTVDITAGVGQNVSGDVSASCREAVAQARAKTSLEPALCITTPDSLAAANTDITGCLREALGERPSILGGASATQENDFSGYQFCCGQMYQDALPVLLFSGPLIYSAGVATGWKPLGKKGA
jgi:hypothetical protein